MCTLLLAAFVTCSSCAETTGPDGTDAPAQQEQQAEFRLADGSVSLAGEIAFPQGSGPFPAVVVMSPRSCEGPAGIPPGWQQTTLTSWGYATLTIDSFAARGLGPAACSDFTALQPSQTIGDAYGALEFLASNPRIDAHRIALLGFGGRAPRLCSRTQSKPGTIMRRAGDSAFERSSHSIRTAISNLFIPQPSTRRNESLPANAMISRRRAAASR